MTVNEKPVVDFDHHSKEYADGWREVTAELRNRCPVAWTDAHGGYWVASSYDAVREAALDDVTFSSDNDLTGERGGGKAIGLPGDPFGGNERNRRSVTRGNHGVPLCALLENFAPGRLRGTPGRNRDLRADPGGGKADAGGALRIRSAR